MSVSLRKLLRPILRWPILGPAARMARRFRVGWAYVGQPSRAFASWVLSGSEESNFTYDLTERNRQHLAAFVATVTGIDPELALDHIRELEQDPRIQEHFRVIMPPGRGGRGTRALFGRRLGWYAIARALRPALVVETGVDKGMGACALAAALLRNGEEGRPGRYLGTDIDPGAGMLFRGPYAATGRILYGDSLASLGQLGDPIDLFINDSDHSAAYEAREYVAVERLLSQRAVVLADNAHATDELLRFARRTRRQFLFFREQPADHWYPGAGIGAAFPRGR